MPNGSTATKSRSSAMFSTAETARKISGTEEFPSARSIQEKKLYTDVAIRQKIRPHAGTDFIRDAKKRKDRLDACINSEIQHERNGKDQQKRVENRKF